MPNHGLGFPPPPPPSPAGKRAHPSVGATLPNPRRLHAKSAQAKRRRPSPSRQVRIGGLGQDLKTVIARSDFCRRFPLHFSSRPFAGVGMSGTRPSDCGAAITMDSWANPASGPGEGCAPERRRAAPVAQRLPARSPQATPPTSHDHQPSRRRAPHPVDPPPPRSPLQPPPWTRLPAILPCKYTALGIAARLAALSR